MVDGDPMKADVSADGRRGIIPVGHEHVGRNSAGGREMRYTVSALPTANDDLLHPPKLSL